MSYFETNDKAVLSVFCGSIGLVVFFWFFTKSVATAAPEWIAPLVVLFLAAMYMIPTIRRMVVLIEDVEENQVRSSAHGGSTKTTKRRARLRPNLLAR